MCTQVRGIALAALGIASMSAVACASRVTEVVVPSTLDGAWSTRSSGVLAAVTLTWTADSVTGTGTYTAIASSLGCGGATLSGSGTFSLAAKRTGASLSGYMSFDNGWVPPYSGTLESESTIDGSFMSIDSGPCAFPLFHGLVP